MDNAFRYIQANGGIDTEASYPYEGYNDRCRFRAVDVGATNSGKAVNLKSRKENRFVLGCRLFPERMPSSVATV